MGRCGPNVVSESEYLEETLWALGHALGMKRLPAESKNVKHGGCKPFSDQTDRTKQEPPKFSKQSFA